MHWSKRTVVPVVTVALACSKGDSKALDQTLATLSAGVPDVPHVLADLSGSPILQEITDNGPYLGFDTFGYPGDAAMRTWREHAGYDWVGYYLQAPCHKGTAIFLDVEHMNSVPNAMREYYLAWTERLLDDGRYRPAYYAHNANAQAIYADVRALLDGQGIEADPPFWIAGGSNFGRDRDPREVGHAFADVWQGVLDTWEKHATVRLPIDVNVAAVPSPSAAQYASAD